MLNNKSLLITGGTGSLGKMLTKTILSKYPKIKRLVIFSRDEFKQYEMEKELKINMEIVWLSELVLTETVLT